MSKPADFIQKWREQGHQFHPPTTSEAIKLVFSRLGMAATQDILEFYLECDGMSDCGAGLVRFWPLAEIEANAQYTNEFGVLFADFLLESELFRIKPKDEYSVQVYSDCFDGDKPRLVSQSLGEFMRKIDIDDLQGN
ncbi:SMI1/KNR4 family protein [Hahella sp. CR1]|uniref:hypothetical protein n=1 Tax=Hahella sp. CR1 TaxID=2992807 RepID=UPI00244131B7|nr:hypothetical protein [Hahella sp. CR1]MDG9671614.1 SMI1/KNR4 family protein [Hahella sp. CR1]